jgi:hypothetical protein
MKRPPADQIWNDRQHARSLGIRSTPFSLVGVTDGPAVLVTDFVAGAKPWNVFMSRIDAALARVGVTPARIP